MVQAGKNFPEPKPPNPYPANLTPTQIYNANIENVPLLGISLNF